MWRFSIFLFVVFSINFCFSQKEPVGQNLILFLVDGLGANLFNNTDSRMKFGAKTLIENGVEADYLIPVFPTQSYPNWFSLATGLYVENHNFTADFMFDPNNTLFFERDLGSDDLNEKWWRANPAPFWYSVGKAGIDVHCYWFATCHMPYVDLVVQVPLSRRHSFKNDEEHDLYSYIPNIMKYIQKYQVYRKQLVLLRYDGLGKALRTHGEDSEQTVQELSNFDQQVRKIQEEMETWDLLRSTNLIVLSDHGLIKSEEQNQYYIEECIADSTKVKQIANSLAFALIWPEEEEEDTIFFELKFCDQWANLASVDYEGETKEVEPSVGVYRQHEIPERFHWKNSRFIAPIVLIAQPGYQLLTRQIPSTSVSEKFGREWKMLDGWDNENPDLQGIFMARGPAFKSGYKGGPLEIVDIYQLVLNMLGVDPCHPNNGSWERVSEFLSDELEERSYQPQNFGIRNSKPITLLLVVIEILLVCNFSFYFLPADLF
uniref:Uncharacterized protein n=1 Tax=Meloidogyne enterolobii TaxID=390850 RepID=A0A6V7U6A2_MELEN|nr:unnamed protein product [Meloidogyne enterolobii]